MCIPRKDSVYLIKRASYECWVILAWSLKFTIDRMTFSISELTIVLTRKHPLFVKYLTGSAKQICSSLYQGRSIFLGIRCSVFALMTIFHQKCMHM